MTKIRAEKTIDGVPINPRLPRAFDSTSNDERPASHQKFWNVPFIVTETVAAHDAFYAGRTDDYAEEGRKYWAQARPKWMASWSDGTRYDVRCLDGGAWDRSTWWGSFGKLEEALECAKAGPTWRG